MMRCRGSDTSADHHKIIGQPLVGGLPTCDSYADLDELASELNAAFLRGYASMHAQTHLFNGVCQ